MNSPKILLDMIFNTINLYGLTCIPKIEVPLQVVNGVGLLIFKREDLNSNLNINQDTL
jgi:hypothetical protein